MQQTQLDSVRAVTFDMYGTLLDLEATFAPCFRDFLVAKGYSGDAAGVVEAWERDYLHESMVDTLVGGGRTPFERVRRVTLSQRFSKLKIEHTQDEIEAVLGRATPTLFPDVLEGLGRLREKYTLAVLSNGDLASLERAVEGLAIPVERTISAEQAGYYKPHSEVYRHGVRQLGLENNQILHVAAHGWDIRGAKATGMLGAYINRYGVPYTLGGPERPDLEAAGLIEFASLVT
jgi:2-haloacid dehalogenase